MPRSTRFGLAFLGSVLIFLVIALPTTGIVSYELGKQHSTYTCTVQSITYSPLRDGEEAWQVATDCGGQIYINPSAAGQTPTEGTLLAGALRPGQRYHLTVKGVLHTPFSAELLRATPAPPPAGPHS